MLEVCVDTIQGAVAAQKAGADRIELCSALELGGVTPSGPLVTAVRREIQLPLIVLIRARAGNFIFNPFEQELVVAEAKQAIELGADGVAIGGLVDSGDLDLKLLRSAAAVLPKCQLVMHRAFDYVRDPIQALEQLVEIGFTRVLTSGGQDTAIKGVLTLKRLVESARNRIEILPAGGIRSDNALEILTGSSNRRFGQLHGSFRELVTNRNGYSLPDPAEIKMTKAVLALFNS